MSRPALETGPPPGTGWSAGLSLVELLIVVTLVGIAALTAGPLTRDLRDGQAVRQAMDRLVSRHALARSAAVRHGRVAELHIDGGTDRFWVTVDTSAAGTGVLDTVGSVEDLAEAGVELTSSRSLLCFDIRGLATEAGACPPGDAVLITSRGRHADTVTTTVSGLLLR